MKYQPRKEPGDGPSSNEANGKSSGMLTKQETSTITEHQQMKAKLI
jgi:hypothetical protein